MKKLLFVLFLFVIVFVVGCGQSVENIVENSTELKISPESAELYVGQTQQFTISGMVLKSDTSYPASWEVIGGIGTIDATGLFTATETGEGTISVAIDGMKGSSDVVVTTRSVSGVVKEQNIYSLDNMAPVAGASVRVGEKYVFTLSDGSYNIENYSSDEKKISAWAQGYYPIVFDLESREMSLSLLYPDLINAPYYNTVSFINAKIVDKDGNHLQVDSSQVKMAIEWGSQRSFSCDTNGVMSIEVSNYRNKDIHGSLNGFICLMVEQVDGTYKSGFKEFTVDVADTIIDVGEISLSLDALTVSGTISTVEGVPFDEIAFGKFNYYYNSIYLFDSYNENPNFGEVDNNNYLVRVPKLEAGNKFCFDFSSYGYDYSHGHGLYIDKFKYLDDFSGLNNKYNVELLSPIVVISPVNNQTYSISTPRIEWESQGDGYCYLVIIAENNKPGMNFCFVTKNNYIDCPDFPEGSGAEKYNLQNGKTYGINISAFQSSKDINFSDISLKKMFDGMMEVKGFYGTTFSIGQGASVTAKRSRKQSAKKEKYQWNPFGDYFRGIGIYR